MIALWRTTDVYSPCTAFFGLYYVNVLAPVILYFRDDYKERLSARSDLARARNARQRALASLHAAMAGLQQPAEQPVALAAEQLAAQLMALAAQQPAVLPMALTAAQIAVQFMGQAAQQPAGQPVEGPQHAE